MFLSDSRPTFDFFLALLHRLLLLSLSLFFLNFHQWWRLLGLFLIMWMFWMVSFILMVPTTSHKLAPRPILLMAIIPMTDAVESLSTPLLLHERTLVIFWQGVTVCA